MSSEETIKFLKTTMDGLPTEEADNRIRKFGYNVAGIWLE